MSVDLSKYVSLPGVPETITRRQYLDLIKGLGLGLGLEVNDLTRLEFQVNGIYAEVFAVNEQGRRYTVDGKNVATHRICIRVIDEEPE